MISKLFKISNTQLSLDRKIVRLIKYSYLISLAFRAYKLRYKKLRKRGFFRKDLLTRNETKLYKEYWGALGCLPETETIKLIKRRYNEFHLQIVPENIFVADIEPSLCRIKGIELLSNKNIYDLFIKSNLMPSSFLHKINGFYYDKGMARVDDIESYLLSLPNLNYVIKESSYSSGGKDVFFISKNQIMDYLDKYENFVLQERLEQHEQIDSLYSDSVCTVRSCVYRAAGGMIKVLNNTLRVGKDGSLDNETAGGLSISINDNGGLHHLAFDKSGIAYEEHPNTRIQFKNFYVPKYDKLNECASWVMTQIPWAKLLSLDFCLDVHGDWRLLEINSYEQTIRFAQFAGKPFFGEFTDDVISECIENHWILK